MSWFAVRDENGKYWDFEGMDDYRKPLSATDRGRKWAEEVKANTGGSEIIEVVEKTAPIVVSEAEAEMLKKAKNTTVWRPASVIARYAYEHEQQGDDEVLLEDRLMRAYVIGWTVEKPKRWNVKVPHVKHYVYRIADGELTIEPDSVGSEFAKLTAVEIDYYGLGDCEKAEVKD
ncbi:DUF1642 domain-containing protein [Lacticaseibacillus absianus]|uniref:DUF1642 domain-containing protein n=1 Tax=Lacticaseibacillus absianus TaxID=2729623 RepID=UPI0015CB3D4E|nr:DUF1642 domain-containing protein [Lacticaseibacillus absianus]